MATPTPPAGGAGGGANPIDLNSKKLNTGPLAEAAADAINLYGQVQKAAIAYEFATAGAKLGKDKAKSISS